MLTYSTTDCAWCLFDRGIDPGEGSHGICKSHAQKMVITRQEQLQKKYDVLLSAYNKVNPYFERGVALGYGGY